MLNSKVCLVQLTALCVCWYSRSILLQKFSK